MMTMYPSVKRVEPLEDYGLLLEFDSGEKRFFDVKPLLSFGKFHELTSPRMLRTVKVVFDTIGWENGLDLDPEYLYERSEPFSDERLVTDGRQASDNRL